MRKFDFKKIDAFTTYNSDGNPAGYIRLDSINDINDEDMLRIAKELKGFVNEIGYVSKVDNTNYKLRYFSSEREVEFCGHATIAIMYDIIQNTRELSNTSEISIVTNIGNLIVENRIKVDDAVFIMAPIPKFINSEIPKEKIAEALKIEVSDIDLSFDIDIINAGLETLIISINSLEKLLELKPQLEELKEFCKKNSLDIIEVVCRETTSSNNSFRTRVFAPTFGYLEDPATGSGNSALGYYLLRHNMWNGKIISIEQNEFKDKYNIIKLKTQIDSNGVNRVLFGGGAIVRIEGNYYLS